MTTRSLIVRRRDIESVPRPPGGRFAESRWLPVPVPERLSGALGIFCADTTDALVALTYDDGPHPVHTPAILDALARHGSHATFFVLARQARAHPDIVQRIVAEGHELALHGDDHRSLRTMSHRAGLDMIRACAREVGDIGGARVRLYRPPYGAHTPRHALAIRRLGMEVVLWSGDGLDWVHDEEAAIAARALDSAFPGGIILMHDDRGDPETLAEHETAPAFDRGQVTSLLLDGLESRGLHAVTVGALLEGRAAVRSIAKGRAWGEGS